MTIDIMTIREVAKYLKITETLPIALNQIVSYQVSKLGELALSAKRD